MAPRRENPAESSSAAVISSGASRGRKGGQGALEKTSAERTQLKASAESARQKANSEQRVRRMAAAAKRIESERALQALVENAERSRTGKGAAEQKNQEERVAPKASQARPTE